MAAVLGVLACAALVTSTEALASVNLRVSSSHEPASRPVPAGTYALYEISVSNVGGSDASSGPITVDFSVPPGLEITSVSDEILRDFGELGAWDCTIATGAASARCDGIDVSGQFGGPLPIAAGSEACLDAVAVRCRILVAVKAKPDALTGTLTPTITACGGGATICPEVAAEANDDPIEVVPFRFQIVSFDGEILDELGNPATQAGSHPHTVGTSFLVNTFLDSGGLTLPAENVRDVAVKLPAGLTVNPQAYPRCTKQQLTAEDCPSTSQVGTVVVATETAGTTPKKAAVFNMEAAFGTPALFGFSIERAVVYLHAEMRSAADYGVNMISKNAHQIIPFRGVAFSFWGVPADSDHDAERYCGGGKYGCPSTAARKPFLTLPTSCAGAGPNNSVETSLELISWLGSSDEAAFFSHDNSEPIPNPVGADGCNAVDFSPALEARPTTNVADAPSGLDVAVHIPQNDDPGGTASAHLKDITVTLPDGLGLNPAGANGLDGCSAAEIDLNGPDPAECPDASKLGRAEISTPLLESPIFGSVYLAEPHRNPFDSLLAVYLAVDDPRSGIVVKLAGRVTPSPHTGRLSASFEENPQLPFEHVELHLFGGAGAPLRTPAVCGNYSTTSVLTPWTAPDGALRTPSDVYGISRAADGGVCPESQGGLPNSFSLDAGTVLPIAGASTPFVLELRREAGSQSFDSLSLSGPPGLTATLNGVPRCPGPAVEAISSSPGTARSEMEHPSCPASTYVGSVSVGSGAGPQPLYVPGTAYLTGPYRGAPFSLAVVVPVLAGPFDLGSVVLRIAVNVDPTNAQLHLASDPIPSTIAGVPPDLRRLYISFDRPGFVQNPTSCDPMSVTASVISSDASTIDVSRRFQVGGCGQLGFRPRFDLRFTGTVARNGHPGLRAVLRPRVNDANLADAAFTLPAGVLLDLRHVRALCARHLPPRNCPAGSRIGYARLWSPLLEAPFEGPIYLRTLSRRLPGLLADLHSDQFHVLLRGHTAAPNGRLRVRFPALPDAPLSEAVFTFDGGPAGIFVNSESVCSRSRRATAFLVAHDGRHRLLRSAAGVRGPC